jgi:hypothetical protein
MNTEVGFETQGGGQAGPDGCFQELQHVAARMQPRNIIFRNSTNVTEIQFPYQQVRNPYSLLTAKIKMK